MLRTLGTALLAVALTACGTGDGDSADDPPSSPTTPPTTPTPAAPTTLGPLPDLTVATTGEQPCTSAKRVVFDRALASGGVWMPNAPLARMDDLEDAWLCAPDLPALQWQDVVIVFLPDAPDGHPRQFFVQAIDDLGRGTIENALGVPALVLEPDGEQPAEVELVMGSTHIVLIGQGAATGEELLEVAASMAPLH
jgi:hypothetical protein